MSFTEPKPAYVPGVQEEPSGRKQLRGISFNENQRSLAAESRWILGYVDDFLAWNQGAALE